MIDRVRGGSCEIVDDKKEATAAIEAIKKEAAAASEAQKTDFASAVLVTFETQSIIWYLGPEFIEKPKHILTVLGEEVFEEISFAYSTCK